jgi:hypothetical protein
MSNSINFTEFPTTRSRASKARHTYSSEHIAGSSNGNRVMCDGIGASPHLDIVTLATAMDASTRLLV